MSIITELLHEKKILLKPYKRFIYTIYILFMLFTIPMFSNPIKRFDTAFNGLLKNDLSLAEKAFGKAAAKEGKDRLLALYELGNFYHLSGDFKKSIYYFNLADAVAHNYEDKALISAGDVINNINAILFNDSTLQYEGFNYEKVMSHTINAINYLFLGDMEGARVECRKADEYQRLTYDHSIKLLNNSNSRWINNIQLSSYNEIVQHSKINNLYTVAKYRKMLGDIKNTDNFLENVFTHYLASQIYLLQGEPGLNDAMIEIDRAFSLMPYNSAIRCAYLDIADAHGGSSLEKAKNKLKLLNSNINTVSTCKDGGSVIVCHEAGMVPRIEEITLPFIISNMSYRVSLPIYNDFGILQAPVAIRTDSENIVTTTVASINNLAIKNLKERMSPIITRSLLGVVAKSEIQHKLNEKGGSLIGSMAGVISFATTSADRRSWLSLPAEINIAKFNLNSGQNSFTIYSNNGPFGFQWSETITLNVKKGSYHFILIRYFPGSPGFRKIDIKTFDAKSIN